MNIAKQLLLLSSFGVPVGVDDVFRKHQYQVKQVKTLRLALAQIKQTCPAVVIAEFVYAPTYGSQLSNFESLLAAIQNFAPETNFIALTHKDDLQHLDKISIDIDNYWVLTLPLDESKLDDRLKSISNN